ncbi:Septin-domain-containing protein [Chytriomyces sp. MP71]|nr:Septin-domain-containing protein [Chytriomyces sp. MP71]
MRWRWDLTGADERGRANAWARGLPVGDRQAPKLNTTSLPSFQEHALQFRGRFPDSGAWKLPRSQPVRLSEPLGIGHLPAQRVRRSKRKPYVFNMMVVGDSGLGKTTFLNTLFNAPLSDESQPRRPLAETTTVEMTPTTYELIEDGVILHLTVIDTPGFGDKLNRESDFLPISDYIEKQYTKYHECERSDEMRKDIIDTRVHALLYFIPPTGNGLRDLDIEFMQRLCTKVNIIPVIGKADALMYEEAAVFKKLILKDFQRYDIRVYPTHHSDERETVNEIEKHMPFAVIGSDDFIEVDGKKVRGRAYRWGAVEVENPKHCDFIYLRDMVIRTNLQDLIETTHNIHYALFRSSKIRGSVVGRPESILASDEVYDQQVEGAQLNAKAEMQRKEDELKAGFVLKIREKEQQLREREEALKAKQIQLNDEIERMRIQLEQ